MLNRRTLLSTLAGTVFAPAFAQTTDKLTYLYPAPGSLPAFSPFAIAREKGYYAAEGLEINWQTGRGGVDVAKQLAAGNAQLGGGIGDTAIIVRAQDAAVRGVALLGGKTLTQIYVRKEANIKSLDDIKGKKVGVLAFQDTTYFNLLGVLKSRNLKRDDVDIQAVGPAGMVQLMISGALDAISGVPEWAAAIRAAGVELLMYNVDTVFPAMAQAIMASDEMIKTRPETVRKFVRATLKALADIRANPAEMAKLYCKAQPEHTGKEGFIEHVMKQYIELVYATEAGMTLGKFDEKRVATVQAFYKDAGIIDKTTDIKMLYTNDFCVMRGKDIFITLLVGAFMLLLWEFVPPALNVPKFIFPTFSQTLTEFFRMMSNENLLHHFTSTAVMTLIGFVLGSLLGAAGGYLLGLSQTFERVLSPYLLGLQIAPKVAFAPLFIMWFGFTFWPKLLVTVLIVFFPVLVNVLQAMKLVDRDQINLARAYSMTRAQIFWKIDVPSSLPALFSGLRIGATLAVIGVTVGELVGGNTGLGFLITFAEGQANAAMVFNAILLLTLIGILLYSATAYLETRILHYIPKIER